jgi:phosphoribosylglycinamide formyltransferase-1
MSACRLLGGRSFQFTLSFEGPDIKHDRGRRTLVKPLPSVPHALTRVGAPDFSRGSAARFAARKEIVALRLTLVEPFPRPGELVANSPGRFFSRHSSLVTRHRFLTGEEKSNRDNAKIKNRHNALQRKEIAKPNRDKNTACCSPHLRPRPRAFLATPIPKLRDSGHSPLATGLCYFRADMTRRIGVLLSGRGSNFEALADSVAAGRIPNAEIAIVLSNREGAPGIERARERGIPAQAIPSKGLEREPYDKLVVAALREKNVELVCLAGYMRLLSRYFVGAFPNKILNIHPSLLPAFPGLESQRQALEHGAKFTGCTVHFVDENLDAGPIIVQAAVPIQDSDTVETLSERVLREEHRIYTEAVRIVLEGRYRIEGRRVLIMPETK